MDTLRSKYDALHAPGGLLSTRRNRQIASFSLVALFFLLVISQSNHPLIRQPNPEQQVAKHSGYRSTAERVERSHKLYADSIKRRQKLIKKLGPNPADLEAFPGGKAQRNRRMYVLWDFLSPAFTCPHEVERIGPAGDGGKWICGPDRVLQVPNCIIYSFGVEMNSAYEAGLLRASPSCSVFLYDGSAPQSGSELHDTPYLSKRTTFQSYRLDSVNLPSSPANPETKTLEAIMRENGHGWIDILKIDTEGTEFELLMDIIRRSRATADGVLPFGQLQLEIHAWDKSFKDWLEWWELLESAGLRPFSRELNYQDAHNGGSPRVIEYSFINVKVRHHILDDVL